MLREGNVVKHRRFLARAAVAGLSWVLIHGSASGDELVTPGRDRGELAQAKESFAPSDMETESRFEIVAEWRNLRKTQRSRMTDAVITQIYAAMDDKGYALRNPTGAAVKRDIAYTVRRLPLFGPLLKERFPANMPRSTLGTMFALNDTAEAMLGELEKANAENVSRIGYSMTSAEMQTFLRALIDRDREAHLKHRALFHDSFRPE